MVLVRCLATFRTISRLNCRRVSVLCAPNEMSSDPNLLKPPVHVSCQKTLNKTLFDKNITIPCLVVGQEVKISAVMPVVKKYLLKMENFKPVKTCSEHTEVYLNPELVNTWNDLTELDRKSLRELSFNENHLERRSYTLKYDNYSVETILRAVLPKDVEGLSSFTKVGHIVHVNIREHLIAYKDVIGQVLFEKIPGCRSVVNKVTNIDNTYRNFQMEVLRGETKMETRVKENKCVFEFDFAKVYWNSRLGTEHERIVNMVESGAVFFDVFAGVGPFSIPLAKRKCLVYANDLNPESYKWLNKNSTLNKIDRSYLKIYNKDGRDFILKDVRRLLLQYLGKQKIYIVMNLPAMAVDFLDAFINLYSEEELEEFDNPPIVVVYCFAKGEDYENIAKNLLLSKLGPVGDKIIEIFRVRTVSSLKEMMRVVFKLDRDILVGLVGNAQKRKHEDDCQNAKKCNYGEEQEKDQ